MARSHIDMDAAEEDCWVVFCKCSVGAEILRKETASIVEHFLSYVELWDDDTGAPRVDGLLACA